MASVRLLTENDITQDQENDVFELLETEFDTFWRDLNYQLKDMLPNHQIEIDVVVS